MAESKTYYSVVVDHAGDMKVVSYLQPTKREERKVADRDNREFLEMFEDEAKAQAYAREIAHTYRECRRCN